MPTTIQTTEEAELESNASAKLPDGQYDKGPPLAADGTLLNQNGGQPWSVQSMAHSSDSEWLRTFFQQETALLLSTKRLFDVLGALAGLLVLGPVMLVGMLLVWLEDGGPVIFRQERVGLYGKRFTLWKIRTMVKDAESRLAEVSALNQHTDLRTFKAKADPRVLRCGKMLRKYSIDEFPQLWNVLCGQMSLVGPRPSLAREVALYAPGDHLRFIVKPGLTCYWQISGRGEVPFAAQLELDLKYIRERSAMTDILIIVKTIPSLIRANGAH